MIVKKRKQKNFKEKLNALLKEKLKKNAKD